MLKHVKFLFNPLTTSLLASMFYFNFVFFQYKMHNGNVTRIRSFVFEVLNLLNVVRQLSCMCVSTPVPGASPVTDTGWG